MPGTNFFGGTTLVNETFYNNDGTVARKTSTGSPDVLYAYNSLGERIRTIRDIDDDGNIDLAGPDRISEKQTVYSKDENGDWWFVSTQSVYTNGVIAPVTTGISRTRLTGLGDTRSVTLSTGDSYDVRLVSEQTTTDIRDNVTSSIQLINRDQKTEIGLTSNPASVLTNASVAVAGLQVKSVSDAGVVTTYWYDNAGRGIMSGNLSADVLQSDPSTIEELESAVASSSDRNTYNLTGYNDKGQVEWSRDSGSDTAWYAYNSYGQRYAVIRVVDPSAALTSAQLANESYVLSLLSNEDFNSAYTEYSPEGKVIATWGNAYPVAYGYDDQRRLVAMATTRDENYRSSNLLTLLPEGVALSDTAHLSYPSQLDTTKWLYDEATGLLTNKLYSDSKGPSYSYTLDGKLSQRKWSRGVTTDYEYDFAGSLTNVLYSDETPSVAYTYDRLGRRLSAISSVSTNIFVYAPTLELDYEIQNGVKFDRSSDPLGRNTGFSVLNSAEQPVTAVSYSYDAYGRFSSLQSGTGTETNLYTYSYLPGSDLLAGYTATTPTAGSINVTVSRSYELNRNLITSITNSVGSVPSVVSSFNYHNDTLGRRTQRSDHYNDGSNPSTTANTFDYNSFSEVTNAVMGTALYNYEYDPIGNRTEALMDTSGQAYLANSLNQYTNVKNNTGGPLNYYPEYDADGNMLTRNKTFYIYDAENRLIMTTNTFNGVTLKYTYDDQFRRIAMSKYIGYSLYQVNKFTYDGWNLVSEQTKKKEKKKVTVII